MQLSTDTRGIDSPGVGVMAVMIYLVWVLEAELWFSGREVNSLNSFSLQLHIYTFKPLYYSGFSRGAELIEYITKEIWRPLELGLGYINIAKFTRKVGKYEASLYCLPPENGEKN